MFAQVSRTIAGSSIRAWPPRDEPTQVRHELSLDEFSPREAKVLRIRFELGTNTELPTPAYNVPDSAAGEPAT